MDSLKFEIVYCQQLKNSINTDASQHRERERVETTLGMKESLQFLALAINHLNYIHMDQNCIISLLTL